jgi:mRNA interferase MazF
LDAKDQDLLVARVTTQRHQSPFDIAVSDWKQAGLLAPSWVRVHKLAAVEKRLVRRKLGRLSGQDWSTVQTLILQMLG